MNDLFYSSEMKLLHQAVRLDDEASALIETRRIVSNETIDWDNLFLRADLHQIKPQVSIMLSKLYLESVPASAMKRFKEAHRENIYQQLRNATEYFRVKERLDKEGIVAVPFKGMWIANDFYGSLGDRESSDIDLFIDKNDLGKIRLIMTDLGFTVQDTLTKLTEEYILGELAEYNFNNYSGEERISHFEYHYRMGLRSYHMDISMDDLKSQIIDGKIQNRSLKVLTPAANLLLVIMHHGGKDQYMKLKDILDIALIIRKHKDVDWEWLLKKAEKFKVKKLVFLGIRLASEITGIMVPPEISEQVSNASLAGLIKSRLRRIDAPEENWYTSGDELKGWLFNIRAREGFKTKMHLSYYSIRKILLPKMVPPGIRSIFFNKSIRIEPIQKIV